MKIALGYYRARNGEVFCVDKIDNKYGGDLFPMKDIRSSECWTIDGKFTVENYEHEFDLIEFLGTEKPIMEEASTRKDEDDRSTALGSTSSAITSWDLFAAAVLVNGDCDSSDAVRIADEMMKLRKERL